MSSPAPQYRRLRRRSVAGPIVLISLGVLFLLGNMHLLSWAALRHYFALYWPLLLILWGVVRLLEHLRDTREGLPSRGIGAGGVLLVIFIIICGLSFTAADRVNWSALQSEADFDNDFSTIFGNSYNFTNTLEQAIPGNTDLRVVSDRGDLVINTWNEPKVKVVVRKRLTADNEDESKKIDAQTQPTFTLGEKLLTLNANTMAGGNHAVASDLEIYVPRKAALDLSTRRGDVRLSDRDGEVKIATHGDVAVSNVTGGVYVSLRRGSVRASTIKGDVTVDGRGNDVNVSDITGAVNLRGEFFGQMNVSKVTKTVAFKSARTDMEFTRLDGDLAIDPGDLRANAIGGPMHLITRSKDIHLDGVSGDAKIENQNGMVEFRAATLGDVEINNRRGTVQLLLPEHAAFKIDASAHRGEIESDFSEIQVQSDRRDHHALGTVGNGGPQVKVVDEQGDVQIRKSGAVETPPPPAPPKPAKPSGKQKTELKPQNQHVGIVIAPPQDTM
ncbi:MAG: DUF4097 family beta strand repeat-containing protein [Terriglobales bacterium]